MLTGGNIGASLGIALGSVIVLSLLLSAAIYSKKADTDFSKWRIIEIASVVVLLGAAVFPARYAMHFVDIMTSKEELQKAAVEDAASIRGMFKKYEDGERAALTVTTTDLQNAFDQECDINVNQYFTDAAIKNYEDIDTWILNERRFLLGDVSVNNKLPYLNFKQNIDSVLNEWSTDIKSWDIMALGRQSKVGGEIVPVVVSELNELSKAAKLPVINLNSETRLYEMVTPNQIVTLTAPELKFEKALTSSQGINALSLIIYIVNLALILVGYFLTPRSEKTEIGEGQNIFNEEGVNRL